MLLLTTITGIVGFAVGAVCAFLGLRQRVRAAGVVLRLSVFLAVIVNLVYLARAVGTYGAIGAFEHNFELTLLLSTLIALVSIGVNLSSSLRGLDGVLFVFASLVQLSALTVINQPGTAIAGRPWFVSHSLAFAVSAAFFIAGGAAGVAYLLVHRMLRRRRTSTLLGTLAPLESLERFGRWMPILGFPLFTYGILTGFCGLAHRADLGRRALITDLSFVFSVIAWLVYAYLSFGAMYRPQIRGRRAAVLATYGLGLIVVVFLAREFVSPLHR